MYAVSSPPRVYISFFLLLCAAFLFAPSVAHSNEYWSVLEKRFIPSNQVPNAVQEMLGHSVSKPSGSTLSTSPSSPTISKNSLGGLSQTTQNTIKTMGQPSSFNSTLNNSAGAAKNALKSCVRSPACAGRALGAGAIIYEGIYAWKEVYDILADENGSPAVAVPMPVPPEFDGGCFYNGIKFTTCRQAFSYYESLVCNPFNSNRCPYTLESSGNGLYSAIDVKGIPRQAFEDKTLCPSNATMTENGCVSTAEFINSPISLPELDQKIDDTYFPAVSDAPIVLLSGSPESITLSTPASAELPSTTTTNTSSSGQTTTAITNQTINYNITNNNTSNPY